MGHAIQYLSFDIGSSKTIIETEINEYVRCKTIEEGGHGLISPILWEDKEFLSYDEAQRYIDSTDSGNYDQIAVKYRVYPTMKESAKEKEILERIYGAEHSIKTFKSEYIGCPGCGSKFKRTLLRGEKCPLIGCGTDLRGKTTLETINRYQKNIEKFNLQLQQEKASCRAKTSKYKVCWLIKVEYHT